MKYQRLIKLQRKEDTKVNNIDIKILLQMNNIKQLDIAKRLGVSTQRISFLLKYPMCDSARERILIAISEIKEEREAMYAKD